MRAGRQASSRSGAPSADVEYDRGYLIGDGEPDAGRVRMIAIGRAQPGDRVRRQPDVVVDEQHDRAERVLEGPPALPRQRAARRRVMPDAVARTRSRVSASPAASLTTISSGGSFWRIRASRQASSSRGRPQARNADADTEAPAGALMPRVSPRWARLAGRRRHATTSRAGWTIRWRRLLTESVRFATSRSHSSSISTLKTIEAQRYSKTGARRSN